MAAEHLVRWKFEAHTPLNDRDEDTHWYFQFHPDKDEAVRHYISLLGSGVRGIVVEIFRLTHLPKS